ncbi:kinase-like domain-containing protein [Melampsora americana]|nr:kinase-like domain-containing protein [Melampsora americana]
MKQSRSIDFPSPPDFKKWDEGLASNSYFGNLTQADFDAKGERIGEGAFGLVFKAFWKTNQLQCAIKRISRVDGRNNNKDKSIKNEIKLLYDVKHPCIVQIYGFWRTEKHFYIVLEFVPGGDLKSRIEKSSITEQQASLYIKQIAEALQHIHSKNIIHRDIKSQNILLTNNVSIKLCDFGLAVKASSGSTTGFCGSLGSMAPEILRKLPYSKAVDWWALGIVLYTITIDRTSFLPLDRKLPKNYERVIMMNILTKEVEFPASVSSNFCRVVGLLLKKDPSKRLTSLEDLLKEKFFDPETYNVSRFQ